MFLNTLNAEEKSMFLDMAIHVSQINGLIEESEHNILEQYCKEMNIRPSENTELHSVNEIKVFFSNSSDISKRVVALELLGIGYIDGNFDEAENNVVKDFAIGIGLTEDVYNKLNRDIDQYITILGIIQDHVFG
jgi:tellurite resistance protein